MALDKDTLGAARAAAKSMFNGKTIDEILMMYGSLDNARLAIEKADSEAIINHFKANAQLNVPGAGLTAGPTAVTGTSITGSIL